MAPLSAAHSIREANELLNSATSLGLLGLSLSEPPAFAGLELRSDEIFLSSEVALAVNAPGRRRIG